MSFRLFIYYCAVCGAWAAFVGWGLGMLMAPAGKGIWVRFAQDVVPMTALGVLVALALGTVDALWNLSGGQQAVALGRGLSAGVAGGLAGLVGSAVGFALVRTTQQELFILLGWTVTGLLVGGSVGLHERTRKASGRKFRHGLIGGGVGGLVGGGLFLAAGVAMGTLFGKRPDELLSTSAWGFAALGGCVGLFVGLAQVIFREAWITVEAGRRAGRTLILTRGETTIGRAESCDVGLFGEAGIERLHARIAMRENRYVLTDAGTPGGTYLNDRRLSGPEVLNAGDAIRVGGCLLRFGERRRAS